MGYREWRERLNARIDAVTARADERVVRAVEREAEQRAGVAASREARAADAQLSWAEGRARVLGEDHQSLMARAAAVGMGGPPPVRPRRGGVLAALGELIVMDGAGVHGEPRDPYREWRDRIVVEEMCAAKVARGEALSVLDRASLKAARLSSR